MIVRVAVVTVSDGVVRGTRADGSGALITRWVEQRGWQLYKHVQLPDDAAQISEQLIALTNSDCDVVITTGGTGLTARDVTPEATLAVVERLVPGIPEALRGRGAAQTRYSWLSRGVAGTRGRTLIVNLPGSEAAVQDGLMFLEGIIEHAVQLLRGRNTDQHQD